MRSPTSACLLVLIPALASAQSLGDAARQQAKKRGSEAPSARSYSDADLESDVGPPGDLDEAASAGSEATLTKPAEATSAKPTSAKPTSVEPTEAPPAEDALRAELDREERKRKAQEALWRNLCSQAQQRIERAQREYERCRAFPGG